MSQASRTDKSSGIPSGLSIDSRTEAGAIWDALLTEVVRVSAAPSTSAEPSNEAAGLNTVPEASAQRAYPHIYDEVAGGGSAAMSLIAQARQEATAAKDAWTDADLQEVESLLAQLAATLAAAHRHTQFNECLGAVVSFIRRAVLNTDIGDINLGSMMLLIQALNTLHSQPMLSLDAATDITERLNDGGWVGKHQVVSAYVRAASGASMQPLAEGAMSVQNVDLS